MSRQETNPQPNNEQLRELLSAYIDQELTPAEEQVVQRALAQSAELRQELESLRHTVTLLQQLPRLTTPRPLTLSEMDVELTGHDSSQHLSLSTWLWGWSTAVMAAMVIGGVLWFGQIAPPQEVAYQPETAAETTTTASEPAPPIAQEQAPSREETASDATIEPTASIADTTSELAHEEAADTEMLSDAAEIAPDDALEAEPPSDAAEIIQPRTLDDEVAITETRTQENPATTRSLKQSAPPPSEGMAFGSATGLTESAPRESNLTKPTPTDELTQTETIPQTETTVTLLPTPQTVTTTSSASVTITATNLPTTISDDVPSRPVWQWSVLLGILVAISLLIAWTLVRRKSH